MCVGSRKKKSRKFATIIHFGCSYSYKSDGVYLARLGLLWSPGRVLCPCRPGGGGEDREEGELRERERGKTESYRLFQIIKKGKNRWRRP